MTTILPNGIEIPDPDLWIWLAYDFRCVAHPHIYGVCLHENPPKSKNPHWREQPWTRYCVCAHCHEQIHEMRTLERDAFLDFNRTKNCPDAERLLCQ